MITRRKIQNRQRTKNALRRATRRDDKIHKSLRHRKNKVARKYSSAKNNRLNIHEMTGGAPPPIPVKFDVTQPRTFAVICKCKPGEPEPTGNITSLSDFTRYGVNIVGFVKYTPDEKVSTVPDKPIKDKKNARVLSFYHHNNGYSDFFLNNSVITPYGIKDNTTLPAKTNNTPYFFDSVYKLLLSLSMTKLTKEQFEKAFACCASRFYTYYPPYYYAADGLYDCHGVDGIRYNKLMQSDTPIIKRRRASDSNTHYQLGLLSQEPPSIVNDSPYGNGDHAQHELYIPLDEHLSSITMVFTKNMTVGVDGSVRYRANQGLVERQFNSRGYYASTITEENEHGRKYVSKAQEMEFKKDFVNKGVITDSTFISAISSQIKDGNELSLLQTGPDLYLFDITSIPGLIGEDGFVTIETIDALAAQPAAATQSE